MDWQENTPRSLEALAQIHKPPHELIEAPLGGDYRFASRLHPAVLETDDEPPKRLGPFLVAYVLVRCLVGASCDPWGFHGWAESR